MKTTFRQRNSHSSPLKKRLVFVASTFLITFFAFYFFRSPIVSLSSSIWQTDNSISRGFANTLSFFKSKSELIDENTLLKEKIASYEIELSTKKVLEASLDELLMTFGREVLRDDALAGAVLRRPPETPYDLLVLDVGATSGVDVGDRVSLPEGGALGLVLEVLERESKVSLYSTSNTETNAILERNSLPIVIYGEGGGSFSATVPRDSAVEVGDKVLLPGILPELVAVVSHIEIHPTDSLKKIFLRSVANPSELRFVIIK